MKKTKDTQRNRKTEQKNTSTSGKQSENTDTKQSADAENMEAQVGYPDISKANTKMIVIVSFIFVVIIFLLSIFVPDSSKEDTTTQQDITTAISTELTTEVFKELDSSEHFDMSSTEDATQTSADTGVFNIFELPEPQPGFTTINGNTYYLTNNKSRFSGWLNVDDTCYYFREDGTMVTGWLQIEGKLYYFDDNGIMLTNQWVDDKYVGGNGYVLTNTLTPDGIYVGNDGTENDSVGRSGSKEGLADLKNTLEDMTAGYSGTWSIYVKDIENDEYLSINNVQHFSASLIKLYCAAAAYDLIEKGTLEETENIDSLLAQMISVSDNDAFNLMVMNCAPNHNHVTGRGIIQDYIDKEGYQDTTITSILVPTKYKAPSSPGRNYTTVEDCGMLLEKIYKGKCVSPKSSDKFLDLLLNQTHINKIPAGLPEGTKCANKTGDTNEVQHDAAIVYSPNRTYIICVMSSNCGAAIPNIQKISKTVYEYFN
ncbi:MAG: serine hydrolase [Lachnospiraceae bacterium]